MKWLDKLERKYGKYAIPNLMYYVIILYIIGFVIDIVSPQLYTDYLALDANAILARTDLENFYFYYSAAEQQLFFYTVCIVFVLYDWQDVGIYVGSFSV